MNCDPDFEVTAVKDTKHAYLVSWSDIHCLELDGNFAYWTHLSRSELCPRWCEDRDRSCPQK
jgi:hypothetical protein